ncbi:hypothetical protein MBLNU230_g2238t1 [Neophaeotheca triangularis]
MLAINKTNDSRKVTPNVLPCAIKHNGPIDIADRYWNPRKEADGSRTAHFRGRKLQGKTLKMPEGYEGVVLQKTDRVMPASPQEEEAIDGEESRAVETKVADQTATFDGISVWGHESVPGEDDIFVKSLEEWVGFANAVSNDPLRLS